MRVMCVTSISRQIVAQIMKCVERTKCTLKYHGTCSKKQNIDATHINTIQCPFHY